jgi:Alpha/beta hydrolase of unknown function (DUF900)
MINEISVREHGSNAGGSVVGAYYGTDSEWLDGKGAALLLVHGYNNSREAARGSFDVFVSDLENAGPRTSLPWPVFGVQWPGDEPNPILSAASYPLKIGVAAESANRIADLLRGTFGPGGAPLILYVVSHSLGGRLVVDLLARLLAAREQFNIVVNRVTLMAAAVPVGHVDIDGDLRAGIDVTGGVCVLHSKGDLVLHYAFPIGQTAGFDGFFPTAVGRFGDPSNAWAKNRPMAHARKAYGHSSYWPGAESASEVAAFFGCAVPATTPTASIVDSSLPEPNTITERSTPSAEAFL